MGKIWKGFCFYSSQENFLRRRDIRAVTPKVGDMPGKYIRKEHLWKRELQGQKPWGRKVLCIFMKNYKPSMTVAERKRHQSGVCEVSLRDIASWHQETPKTLPRVLDIIVIAKKPFKNAKGFWTWQNGSVIIWFTFQRVAKNINIVL